MPPLSLTEKQIEFIKANRLLMSGSDMAKKFGVGKSVVNRYMRKNGLSVSDELKAFFRTNKNIGKTTSTPKIDKYLQENYLSVPIKTMSKEINKSSSFVTKRMEQLDLVIPGEIIEQRKENSRYKKGNTPVNKGVPMSKDVYEKAKATMFKKGNKPHNMLPIGSEVVRKDKRTGNSYVLIKIAEYKLIYKHIHAWEQANGKVPKGHNVVFRDGNQMNCDITNLECISNSELMQRNTIHRFPEELKTNIRLLTKLKKKINEKQK